MDTIFALEFCLLGWFRAITKHKSKRNAQDMGQSAPKPSEDTVLLLATRSGGLLGVVDSGILDNMGWFTRL